MKDFVFSPVHCLSSPIVLACSQAMTMLGRQPIIQLQDGNVRSIGGDVTPVMLFFSSNLDNLV